MLQPALPIVPLEAAQVVLASRGPLQVEQLGGPSVLLALNGSLDQVHLRGIERVTQLFTGGQNVVFLTIGDLLASLGQPALVGLGFLGDFFRFGGLQRSTFVF